MVAFVRARESERADAIFSDPFARRLGGDRGEQIARANPSGEQDGMDSGDAHLLV